MVADPSINNPDIKVAGHLWTTVIARSKPNGEEVGRIFNGRPVSVGNPVGEHMRKAHGPLIVPDSWREIPLRTKNSSWMRRAVLAS